MKKIIVFLLLIILILASCTACETKKQKFTESFIDYFDTVATVTGYEDDRDSFNRTAKVVEALLKKYHALFDIYGNYTDINNIKTINDNAGKSPVKVSAEIIELLKYSENIFAITSEKTNITMGPVLKVWHSYRTEGINSPENARLPSNDELITADSFCGYDKLLIDEENGTVYLNSKGASLDVGAIAKGYATEQIAKHLENNGVKGYALNIGGNIRVIGNKPDGEYWTASVKNPNGDGYLMSIELKNKSFVTSGNYVRYYTVNGQNYHHIIDPDTLYPSTEFASVSVLTADSSLADALSTALFCMSYEDGLKIIESFPDTEAVWVRTDGNVLYSTDFENILIKE